jgi:hypothetical protein
VGVGVAGAVGMDRGVQEHYWTVSERGRVQEVVYRPYSDGVDGEHFFQSVVALCFLYFVGRLFFNGLVTTLILGLTVMLVMQLVESVTSSVRPGSKYSRPYSSYWS